jgi:hypothetical protein
MKIPYLKGKIGFKKTLSRSQTKIYKGESIASKWCNTLALGGFRAILNFLLYGCSLEKLRSLPNKRPNEF